MSVVTLLQTVAQQCISVPLPKTLGHLCSTYHFNSASCNVNLKHFSQIFKVLSAGLLSALSVLYPSVIDRMSVALQSSH